jgi:GMP synthase-like glutamine amidotransferase
MTRSSSLILALPPPAVYGARVPILGICYGEQAMAHQLGGKVGAAIRIAFRRNTPERASRKRAHWARIDRSTQSRSTLVPLASRP